MQETFSLWREPWKYGMIKRKESLNLKTEDFSARWWVICSTLAEAYLIGSRKKHLRNKTQSDQVGQAAPTVTTYVKWYRPKHSKDLPLHQVQYYGQCRRTPKWSHESVYLPLQQLFWSKWEQICKLWLVHTEEWVVASRAVQAETSIANAVVLILIMKDQKRRHAKGAVLQVKALTALHPCW